MEKNKRSYEEEDYHFEEIGDEDEIDLIDLIFVMMRSWKLIVSVTVGIIILGVVFALVKPEVYTASTKLMVSNGNYSARSIDKNELSLNQQLVASYAEIARNRRVSQNIIKKFGLAMTPDEMAEKIRVSPVADTEFITISYTDANPRLAAVISNELARSFVIMVSDVMGLQNLKVIEQAETPLYPSGATKQLVVIIAIVVGGIIGVFIAFALELFHSNLRKPEDIEKVMGCSIIGSIPDFEDLEAREVKKDVEK